MMFLQLTSKDPAPASFFINVDDDNFDKKIINKFICIEKTFSMQQKFLFFKSAFSLSLFLLNVKKLVVNPLKK